MENTGKYITIKIIKQYKSIPVLDEFSFPLFTVLTGPNGSGKSHLFECLSNRETSIITYNNRQITNVKYIGFNKLNPKIDEKCDPASISQRSKDIWNHFENAKKNAKHNNYNINSPIENHPIFRYLSETKYKNAILQIIKKTNTSIDNISEDLINDSLTFIDFGDETLFNSQFAFLFKAYHIKEIDNKLNQLYASEGQNISFLDNDNFVKQFGPPPWEFVNSILERMNLPYVVSNPEGNRRETDFIFKLIHKENGIEINSNDLSTGEKTLMSLALAIYNTTNDTFKTDLLIMDEPDAPLHPSMSKLMIDILDQEICKKHNIPVLISSHSPTTIVCSNPLSIYKIEKNEKNPNHCTFSDVMKLLSNDITNLTVAIENRRQVFVENIYDAMYYESIFQILSNKYQFPTIPLFLPPHYHDGTNCTDVIQIVGELASKGNCSVYGLIDFDGGQKSSDRIKVVGDGNRYAIDNYILDPAIVGLYLIKEKIVEPEEVGLLGYKSYLQVATNISNELFQTLINGLSEKMGYETSEYLNYKMLNNIEVNIPSHFFTTRGHDIEEKYKEVWPKLKGVKGKGDSALKMDVINKIINDFPDIISIDLYNLFLSFK